MNNVNVFVSYCQKDSIYADNIDLYFKDKNITVHRDIRDISDWSSIRSYMQTIRDMDYAILIVTDNYLKSYNCMYEVLEVMKEKNYDRKIFTVIAEKSIYSTGGRVPYIKYWEDKFKELQKQIAEIELVNASDLLDELKGTQKICLSMGEFLSRVADMNNPNISDVNVAIENKLKEQGLLDNKKVANYKSTKENKDVFSSLNIPKFNVHTVPTDLEKNIFMKNSFNDINSLLKELCNEVENVDNNIHINVEHVDTKTAIYKFYKSGRQVRALKLFLGNCLGGRDDTIGLSCDNSSISNSNSFNGIISSKVESGELALYFMMGISFSQECRSIEEIVREIWISYIQSYIS
jgi:hypothetical protein